MGRTSLRPASVRMGQQGRHAEKKIQGGIVSTLLVGSRVEYLPKAEGDDEMNAGLTRRGNKAGAIGRGWQWYP